MPDKDKIEKLLLWFVQDHVNYPSDRQSDEMFEEDLAKTVAKITQLLLEERKKGAIEYNAKLNEQDPYEPLPGTPREYATMKLEEYLRGLEAALKEGKDV